MKRLDQSGQALIIWAILLVLVAGVAYWAYQVGSSDKSVASAPVTVWMVPSPNPPKPTPTPKQVWSKAWPQGTQTPHPKPGTKPKPKPRPKPTPTPIFRSFNH